MPWLRYRHKWSSGPCSWSWYFEHKVFRRAPLWVVQHEIRDNDERFRRAEQLARELDHEVTLSQECEECADRGWFPSCATCGRASHRQQGTGRAG